MIIHDLVPSCVLSCMFLYSPISFCTVLSDPEWSCLVLVMYGLIWSDWSCLVLYSLAFLVMYGLIWPCIFLYNLEWSCLVLYCHLRSYLVLFGPVWSCMILYGPVCSFIIWYSRLWSVMVQYGIVQTYMILHGPDFCLVHSSNVSSLIISGLVCSYMIFFLYLALQDTCLLNINDYNLTFTDSSNVAC